jgi:hypothetical protein
VLRDSERLALRLVLHNDIARGRLAYLAYALASRPFGRRSFIHVDGLRSIRRSYRRSELSGLVQPPWQAGGAFPARILLTRSAPPAGGGPAPSAAERDRPGRMRASAP